MTTKEQEFKALNKIKAMVAELGEDSYIATAFEGCFEIAEENIKNDFACSMKRRAEIAEQKAAVEEARAEAAEAYLKDARAARDEWHKTAHDLGADYNKAKKELADLHESAETIAIEWNKATDKVTELQHELKAMKEECKKENELYNQTVDLQKQLDEKDLEIIKLKARLFDMMNA